MNKYELNKTWHKLTLARAVQDSLTVNTSDTTFAVLCLIAHHPDTTIAKVVNHPYFYNVSLSTIKRSITTLLDNNLVSAKGGENDKRERLLNIIKVL